MFGIVGHSPSENNAENPEDNLQLLDANAPKVKITNLHFSISLFLL